MRAGGAALSGAQLDLFADRTLHLLRARDHLSHLETDAAHRALREALSKYSADARLHDEGAVLDELSFRIDKALRAPPGERAAAAQIRRSSADSAVCPPAPTPNAPDCRSWRRSCPPTWAHESCRLHTVWST